MTESLFAEFEGAFDRAALQQAGEAVPPLVRFGTSSWNYPGWRGLVYAWVEANYVRQKFVMLWLLDRGYAI